MKKIFGIVLALALVLSMSVVAAPAAAVSAPVKVTLSDPLTGVQATYTIIFHNDSNLLLGDADFIDVTFPAGTDVTTGPAAANIITAATEALVTAAVAVPIASVAIGTTGLRIHVAADIAKCEWVKLVIDLVENPLPCYHNLQVGSSTHTPVVSEEYAIYSIKIDLLLGWNLISLPVIPADPDITVVLADLILAASPVCAPPPLEFKVYYYDCTTWYAYNNGSYASLTEMTECKAYWIWVDAPISFYVKGDYYPPPPGPPLKKCYHECWNMVGFTSDIAREPFTQVLGAGTPICDVAGLSPYFGSISPPGTVVYILRWDAATQVWGTVIQFAAGDPDPHPVAANSYCLTPGEGYWVAFSADACFAVPPPGV